MIESRPTMQFHRCAAPLWAAILSLAARPVFAAETPAALPPDVAQQLDAQNVVWDSPSADAKGSMPIGNGDLGLNVWVEPSGDLCFFIGKSDAWNENMTLCKVGKVRVKFTPALVEKNQPFEWKLDLKGGRIVVKTAKAEVVLWVDANHNVVQVDATGLNGEKLAATASFEVWRKEKRLLMMLGRKKYREPESYQEPDCTRFVYPDAVLKPQAAQAGWYHRNPESSWMGTLEVQKLQEIAKPQTDPLLNRTFGAVLRGGTGQWLATSDKELAAAATGKLSLTVHVLTAITDTPEAWEAQLKVQADAVDRLDEAQRQAAHAAWWAQFWNRSWIFVEGGKDAKDAKRLTQAYALQRFINAGAGRGKFPIKFNGSLFTVDNTGFGPDFRRWGGGYWLQNTRLPYWSMLEAGDFDLMRPLFDHYFRLLPIRKLATKTYYGHDGAYFPETTTIWGTFLNSNYGTNRKGMPDGLTTNPYIRYHWTGGLELVTLMLDYHDQTQDETFRKETLIPFAKEIMAFFDQHWKRGTDGKIRFSPAQSLETWFNALNPTPDIAGLRHNLPRLLAKTDDPALKAAWQKTLDELPPLPMRADPKTGEKNLLPAQSFGKPTNLENAPLYAVFPFRTFSIASDAQGLAVGRQTWRVRGCPGLLGWGQDAIQAAVLGLTDEARAQVVRHLEVVAPGFRFPAMWGPNYDWMPDQDHGSVMMTGLQYMAMQYEGDKILLLPAWPKDWNAHFKLHAPRNTQVECKFEGGKITLLKVTPEERRKDVVLPEGWQAP